MIRNFYSQKIDLNLYDLRTFFGKEIIPNAVQLKKDQYCNKDFIIIINFKLRTQEKIILTNLITFYFEANILSF